MSLKTGTYGFTDLRLYPCKQSLVCGTARNQRLLCSNLPACRPRLVPFERRSSVLSWRSRSVDPGVLDLSIKSQFWIPWVERVFKEADSVNKRMKAGSRMQSTRNVT